MVVPMGNLGCLSLFGRRVASRRPRRRTRRTGNVALAVTDTCRYSIRAGHPLELLQVQWAAWVVACYAAGGAGLRVIRKL